MVNLLITTLMESAMEMEQKPMLIHAVKVDCGVNDMDLLLHGESNFN